MMVLYRPSDPGVTSIEIYKYVFLDLLLLWSVEQILLLWFLVQERAMSSLFSGEFLFCRCGCGYRKELGTHFLLSWVFKSLVAILQCQRVTHSLAGDVMHTQTCTKGFEHYDRLFIRSNHAGERRIFVPERFIMLRTSEWPFYVPSVSSFSRQKEELVLTMCGWKD